MGAVVPVCLSSSAPSWDAFLRFSMPLVACVTRCKKELSRLPDVDRGRMEDAAEVDEDDETGIDEEGG